MPAPAPRPHQNQAVSRYVAIYGHRARASAAPCTTVYLGQAATLNDWFDVKWNLNFMALHKGGDRVIDYVVPQVPKTNLTRAKHSLHTDVGRTHTKCAIP